MQTCVFQAGVGSDFRNGRGRREGGKQSEFGRENREGGKGGSKKV